VQFHKRYSVIKKIPKYEFNNAQNIAFELTTISDILKKSKSKLTTPHRQNFYGLFIFSNSYGKYFVDFKEYEIKKGTIFFISNEQIQYFKDIDKTIGNVILFTNSFLDNDFLLEQVFEQNTGNPMLYLNTKTVEEFDRLISQIKSVYFSEKKMKLAILKNFLEIILLETFQVSQECSPTQNTNYARFITFKKDLKENYKEEKGVSFYAEKQFISAKTLNIAIRDIIDKSAKQFINDYIILLAKRMLINTSAKTNEISDELGFNEPTNFVKFFKNKENTTPSMFQNSRN